mmetsp:Transcript_8637/g.19841  ORF Transcript_8637/g.19841 Transcript_8637/m.19841 type:complete len:81 (-) Transcript_8637:1150-1392(-)
MTADCRNIRIRRRFKNRCKRCRYDSNFNVNDLRSKSRSSAIYINTSRWHLWTGAMILRNTLRILSSRSLINNLNLRDKIR